MVHDKALFKIIAKLTVVGVVASVFCSCGYADRLKEGSQPKPERRWSQFGFDAASSTEKRVTQGEYMGQEWHAGKKHILYWEGKPYVHHAINDYPAICPLYDKGRYR